MVCLLCSCYWDVLTSLGLPDGVQNGTQISTSTWLTESVDRGLRRSLHRKDYSMVVDYLIQRSMVPKHVDTAHENSPWVFIHGDLHNGNIMIDQDFNITGFVSLPYLGLRQN